MYHLKDISNPLTKENLHKVIINYSNSPVDNYSSSSFYNFLMMNENRTQINELDKDIFFLETYNDFKHAITTIENNIDLRKKIEKKYFELSDLINLFKSKKDFSSPEVLNRVLNGNTTESCLIRKNSSIFHEQLGRNVFKSCKLLDLSQEEFRRGTDLEVKYRIYINPNEKDLYRLAHIIYSRMKEKNIPFYFKLHDATNAEKVSDKIVIYCPQKFLSNYLQILESIKKDYPQIINDCSQPPIMNGVLDKWLGFGSEPIKSGTSYNKQISESIEEELHKTVTAFINRHQNSSININGENIRIGQNAKLRDNKSQLYKNFVLHLSKNNDFMEMLLQSIKENLKNKGVNPNNPSFNINSLQKNNEIFEIRNEIIPYSFDDIKKTYDNYKFVKNNIGENFFINIKTNEIITDQKLIDKGKFAATWVNATKNNRPSESLNNKITEKDYEYAFNNNARKTYEVAANLFSKQLQKTGELDIFEVLSNVKYLNYKYSEDIVKGLFLEQRYADATYKWKYSKTPNAIVQHSVVMTYEAAKLKQAEVQFRNR